MSGPEAAAQAVAARLATDLPGRLTALETRLTLPAGSLAVPQLIQPRDEVELRLEDFPAVLVVPMEAVSFRAMTATATGELYHVRYVMRVYCWSRGEHAADTDLARKRLTLAVRETLLGRQKFDVSRIDPGTFVESYSDLGETEDRATLAAAFIGFEMVMEETVPFPEGTLGAANTITTTTGLLPHPAMQA